MSLLDNRRLHLRNHFDEEIIRAAAELDKEFLQALLKLIEWLGPIQHSQVMQVQMAIQDGGCGIRSLVELASGAYLASWALVADFVEQVLPQRMEWALGRLGEGQKGVGRRRGESWTRQ